MASEKSYDVIVVGGGPGGTSAASFLAMKGRKVLLLEKEKFPRDKTCGDAISGKAVGVLAELGLKDALERAEHGDVCGVTFSSPDGKRAEIFFRKKEGEIEKGYVCRRLVYDNLLWNAAKNMVDARDGVEVMGLVRENGKVAGVKARAKGGEELVFKSNLVIGADGVSSVVAREIRGSDVDADHTCVAYRAYYSGVSQMNGTIEIHFVKSIMPGYFWIFPADGGLANVGLGMLMSDMKKKNVNLQKAMQEIITQNPLFKSRFASAQPASPLKGWSIPLGSKKRALHSDNVLLVGDAAGLVDPFSGEGMGNAMLSGKIAANVADEALLAGDFSSAFLSKYSELLWKEIGEELSLSYKMQRLARIEWLLNLVISKAASSERAREAIAGTFANEKAKKEYTSPLFYLRLLLS
ncbi:MAG: NAD(P)/FAD-dependent oxidoreductase [Candidatus Micrarchaeota archaeon]|nr:NAD(P)/FAD-dependent oxidoreductase [Candidatus Micrarchaeota archaeon]